MIGTKRKATASSPPLPTVPAIREWRAMTAEQRLDFQIEVLDALSDPMVAMSEGRPHKKAKTRALDALSLHFKAIGRTIYLAEEMAVLYPGEKPFSPDLLAVLDVEEPEEDERMSWVVADEGKGLDLVIEVLHKGDRDKDLVENVERYAALGIPEYFVYDRGEQQIHGFRLGAPGSARYQPIVPQHGHFRSNVLGLDFAILGNTLRFLVGEAELPGSADLVRRMQGMMESLGAKADQAQARADQAQAEAAQTQAEAAQAQAQTAKAQAEAAQAQAEAAQAQAEAAQAQAQAAQAQAQAAQAQARDVIAVLRVRGIVVPEADRARILAQTDPACLDRWLEKAVSAASVAEVLAISGPPIQGR